MCITESPTLGYGFLPSPRYKDNKLIRKEDNSRPQYKPYLAAIFFSFSVNNLKRIFHPLHLSAILRAHATLFKHSIFREISMGIYFDITKRYIIKDFFVYIYM